MAMSTVEIELACVVLLLLLILLELGRPR